MIGVVFSCGSRSRIDKEIRDFHHVRVTLPLDSMINLSTKGNISSYEQAKNIYVVYVDSTSCSDCAINHLSDWSQLDIISNGDNSLLKYLFIIAPPRGQYTHVAEQVAKDTSFNEFVFIDTANVFERSNPALPTNKLLHTFLLNSQRQVEIIGSPLTNVRIKEMLMKLLEQEK